MKIYIYIYIYIYMREDMYISCYSKCMTVQKNRLQTHSTPSPLTKEAPHKSMSIARA